MRQRPVWQAIMLALLALAPLAAHAQPAIPGGRRVALVIGNSTYRSVDRLANPANDARLIARTLQASGFTLVGDGPQLDLDKARFDRVVQSFGRALQGAETALFYYSGHGMQVQGVNWLVPVDANPTGQRDLDFQMVDASLVLRQMEGSGTRLNMVVLDACRNNPFAVRGVRASGGGLAEMRAPEGTLISYATQPGNVASDGAAANSPYTAALVAAIRQPGMDVFRVFNQVGLTVKAATAGEQQPWLSTSPISGTFYFLGPVTITQAAPSDETVFWQSIAGSRNLSDFRSYLARYPNGTFADLARTRIAGGSPPAEARRVPPDACVVAPFRGATQPGGARTTLQVPGPAPCTVRLYAQADLTVPWDRIDIADAPRGGIVRVTEGGTGISYEARAGFAGPDAFEITMQGHTAGGRAVSGKVRFDVQVGGR